MILLNKCNEVFKYAFGTYAKSMHQAWSKNPESVHEDWRQYFKNGVKIVKQPQTDESFRKQQQLAVSAYLLIRYYKDRGHELASLDPLNLKNYQQFGKIMAKNPLQMDLINNKVLNESDFDVPFSFPNSEIFTQQLGPFLSEKQQWTIRQLQQRLKSIYSTKVGIQFMHISDLKQQNWLMQQFQKLSTMKWSTQQHKQTLQQLVKIQAFNYFLNDKLKTSKRFGVEGLDTMISGLNVLINQGAKQGIQYIGFGMAHRGRLSALANVFNKPLQKIFGEFQEIDDSKNNWGISGDVKYHLGITTIKQIQGKKVRLSILPNPSHLEAVNPVVMGHVKAVEDSLETDKNSLAVLIHGDAAVAGQGIVYQCLQMSYLDHYNVNGTIHIVANNQIGFTTTPFEARTGLYCTDVAKSIQAPIIHVNADEPQLVHQTMKIAMNYRQKYNKDIFIDIIGYRRYGHNEQDQPSFTQPMMYQQINQHNNICNIYKNRLIAFGIISDSYFNQLWQRQLKKISQAYHESTKENFDVSKWKIPAYHKVVDFSKLGEIKRTGIPSQRLRKLGNQILNISPTFNMHPQIRKIYDSRIKAIEEGKNIDFATAQSLAFGSLLQQGFNIRLSGQDVQRGTFSHRHAVVIDQKTQQKYMPLRNLLKNKEKQRIQIQNSFLSEYAALGFQYGYSITNPNTLTIWQAQFGDFANGAQIIIDNFLSTGEKKWNLQSGLVLNLPHGMDGQGPQHSSGRPERFLQLMSDSYTSLSKQQIMAQEYHPLKKNNMSVIYCSTAANLYHAYRRQLRRDYRKPLINMVSKKLLKLRESQSSFEELNHYRFNAMFDESDKSIDPKAVSKVIILCGQAYYSVLQKRKQLQRNDVAIIRIQQVSPFLYRLLFDIIQKYTNCKDFIWFQQQHRNYGPWNYLSPRIDWTLNLLKKQGKISSYNLRCVSRKNSASPACGKKKKHDQQQAQILKELFK